MHKIQSIEAKVEIRSRLSIKTSLRTESDIYQIFSKKISYILSSRYHRTLDHTDTRPALHMYRVHTVVYIQVRTLYRCHF